MKNRIVKVIQNNEPPTKYDYKYFKVLMKTGKIHTFHYHKNNPIPEADSMIGLTWYELVHLIKSMWYKEIEEGMK